MADNSDGGNGYTPDSSNAYITTDAPSLSSTPSVHSAQNDDLVSSDTDRNNRYFVQIANDDDNALNSPPSQPPIPTTDRPDCNNDDAPHTPNTSTLLPPEIINISFLLLTMTMLMSRP